MVQRTPTVRSPKSIGRIVGLLLLVQSAAGYVVNMVLLRPVLSGPAGFLANAAASAGRVRMAVLLGMTTGALTVGIAITAWPLFRRHSGTMALWFLALSIVGFSLLALEHVTVLTMLSLSQEYASAGGAATEHFQALGSVVRWMRYWAHYANLIVSGGAIFVLYGALWRSALVPRVLAAFGVAAALLHITAVTMPVLGYRIVFLLIMPLGLSHLALSLWLMTRGFDNRGHLLHAEARRVELSGA